MDEQCDLLHLNILLNAILISVISCLTLGKFCVLFKIVLYCYYP